MDLGHFMKKIQIKNRQRAINKQFKAEGGGEPSDELLEKQIELNQLRHEHDIADDSQRINGKYVQ